MGWPTLKYTLFKPSRYYISILFVTLISLLSNLPNFFLYKVALCQDMVPRDFVSARWWTVFGYVRETLTRILPIVLLIVFNAVLIYIVKTSRKRMKSSVNILGASGSNAKKRGSNNPVNNNSTGKQPQSAQPASQPLITAPATNNTNTSNNKKGESGQVKQNGSGSISGNANNNTNGHSSSHIHTAEISLLLKILFFTSRRSFSKRINLLG